ncbi:MAG: diacylglycerol kinase family protein, partial [Myxococcales bacterium]
MANSGGLAIIANPNAHRNRNWPLASQALRKAASGAPLYETRTEAELKEAARRLAREVPRVVAIAGGDGTVTHTVTMLGDAFHGKVPPLALLGGGAYDSLATLGGRGPAEDRLRRLSEAVAIEAPLRTTERDTLRVRGE